MHRQAPAWPAWSRRGQAILRGIQFVFFVYAVSGKHHDAFGTDVRESGDRHILTAEGPGEVWGFIMKFDGATEACL